jgi:hypothetical protein
MKTDPETLEIIKTLYREYQNEVEASDMTPLTKRIYLTHSLNFIRWMEGLFSPGSKQNRTE